MYTRTRNTAIKTSTGNQLCVLRIVRRVLQFFFLVSLQRTKQREQDHIANRARVGEQHGETIDADAFASRGRQSVGQRANIVFVHLMSFFVAPSALAQLPLETAALLFRIVQLAESIADLQAAGEIGR